MDILDCDVKFFHFWAQSVWNSEQDGALPLRSLQPSESTAVIVQHSSRASPEHTCCAWLAASLPRPRHSCCLSLHPVTPFPGQVVLSWVILSVSRWLTVVTQKSWTALFSLKDLMVKFREWLLDVFLSFRCRVSSCAALGVFPFLNFWLWMVTMKTSGSPLFNIPTGRRGPVTSATGSWNPTHTHLLRTVELSSLRAGSAEESRIPGIVHHGVMFSTDSFQSQRSTRPRWLWCVCDVPLPS